jgi:hypothetical protein
MIHLQNTKSQVILGPTTAATTTRSASFDWSGADYATIKVLQSASAGTNGGCSISVLHADSLPTNATQFTTITADLTAQATTSHEAVYHIDLRSKKRYGKVILTPTTNTNDSIITSVEMTLARLEQAPSNTTAMVATTNDVVTIVS